MGYHNSAGEDGHRDHVKVDFKDMFSWFYDAVHKKLTSKPYGTSHGACGTRYGRAQHILGSISGRRDDATVLGLVAGGYI